MSFILFIKKTENNSENWQIENFNEDYLNSNSAPTFVSEQYHSLGNDRVKLFFYDHGSEIPGDSYIQDDEGLYFTFGASIDLETNKSDAKSVFKKLQQNRHSDEIQGDFVSLGLDTNGDGALYSTLMTFNRIFYYEDENVFVFSSEIKLMFNSLNCFRKGGVCDFLNLDFINDSIHNEWTEREFPDYTMMNGIKRLHSTMFVTFNGYKPTFSDNQFKLYDKKWGGLYTNNKKKFYDELFEIIERANKAFLNQLAGKTIEVLMSGGLDSRLTVAILSALAPQYNITLTSKSWGPVDHPDVIIGKRVAETLGISFKNLHGDGELFYPQKIEDFKRCIKLSQGDWNSNDFRTSNVFVKRIVVSGQDNYKRHNWAKIYGMNRWYAARMQYTKTLPIISIEIVNKIALVYSKHNFHNGLFEFSHELLQRFAPSLLDIPLVGMSIPQHFVEPYSTVAKSKTMPSQEVEAYWDPSLVSEALVLNKNAKSCKHEFNINLVANDKRKRRIAMDFASMLNERYL